MVLCRGLQDQVSILSKKTKTVDTFDLTKVYGKQNPALYCYDAFSPDGPCIRSTQCKRITQQSSRNCGRCRQLLKNKLFRKVLRRSKQNRIKKFTNDKYLTHSLLLARTAKLRREVHQYKKQYTILKTDFLSLKRGKARLSSIIAESTARDDCRAVTFNLRLAYRKGYLTDKKRVLEFIGNVTANLRRKNTGKRYNDVSTKFYESLIIMGGPRIAKFVADNLQGPGNDGQITNNYDLY